MTPLDWTVAALNGVVLAADGPYWRQTIPNGDFAAQIVAATITSR